MPRRSAASLAVVSDSLAPARLRPPAHLSDDERAVFVALVAACAPDHFVASDLPLLCSYCEATVMAQLAAKELREGGPVIEGRPSAWMTIREKSCREQVALSMRLRLAPQSRLKAEAAGRRPGSVRPNYIDVMKGLGDA